MARNINSTGLDLIKTFEGLGLEAYLDPVGIWTIGYGHIKNVKEGQTISEREAEELLVDELQEYERGVEDVVRVSLNDNEFSALVSFVYNVGLGALTGSTALKRLNKNDRLGAADALEWWNKGKVKGKVFILKGLVRRRAAERALFLKPTTTEATSKIGESGRAPPLEKESPDRRDNLAGSRTVQGGAVAAAAGTVGAVGALSQSATKGEEPAAVTEAPPAPTPQPPPEPSAPPVGAEPSVPAPQAGEPSAPAAPPTAEEVVTTVKEHPKEVVQKIGTLFDEHPEFYTVAFGIIVLAVIYILVARVDDWFHGRR